MDQQHLALIIFQIIKQRDRAEKSGKKCVIGVHCTHGINRTGYVIAAFLRVNFDTIKMEDAIQMFGASRSPHMFDRDNVIEDLLFTEYA